MTGGWDPFPPPRHGPTFVIALLAFILAVIALVTVVWAIRAGAFEQSLADPSQTLSLAIGPQAVVDHQTLALVPAPPGPVLGYFTDIQQATEEIRLWARWGVTNQCEQSGSWTDSGWNGSQYFEGGLGIRADLYQSVAGHSALEDSPLEQMRYADQVLARIGRGGWTCPIGP